MQKLKAFPSALIILFAALAFITPGFAEYNLNPGHLRDSIHNLNLKDNKQLDFYYSILYNFIRNIETYNAVANKTYIRDNFKIMIGFGFNMCSPEAEAEWDNTFDGKISFKEAKDGKISIDQNQAMKLLKTHVEYCEKKLSEIYKPNWEYFKANERLSLTDICYENGLKYLENGTEIHINMIKYYETSEVQFLENALNGIMKIPE